MNPYSRFLSLSCVALCCAAAAARAADPGDATLDEIVVTATLRSLPQQAYAGSASVLDREALHEAGQQNFADVVALVPNLNWAGDTSLPRYFQIRGIGELQQYQGAPNPSVGFIVDDMDFSGIGGVATLFDVDQIEVLHGPQGTVYGANALAGLIAVRSAAPPAQFGGSVELQAGDYGTRSAGAVLGGPVAALDSSFRLAAQRYQSDGYYYNAYLHADTDRRDELTVRGRWRYEPVDALRVDVALLRVQLDNGYDAWTTDGSRTTQSDQPGVDAQYSTGESLHATWSGFAPATLTAIATHVESSIDYSYDGDWGNPQLWAPYTYQYFEGQARYRADSTVELRAASPAAAGGFAWLAGVYASRLRERLTDTSTGLYVDPFDATQDSTSQSVLRSAYEAHNTALYGQLDGDLGGRTRWSLGLRGERRTTAYADTTTSPGSPLTANRFSPADTLWGGHASLDRAVGDDQHLYVLLARGYKAGGFNLSQGLPAAEVLFGPEYDLNIEAGDKLRLADGRLRMETAVFYMQRHAPQLLTGTQLVADNPNTFIYYTGNARAGYNTGLEGDLEWQASRTVSAGGSAGLLWTQYRGFVQDGIVLPDRELPHAPRWQGAVHAEWHDPRGPFARIDVTGMAAFYFDLPPNPTRSNPYGLVNIRAGWRVADWELSAWVRNALDKAYAVRGFYFGDVPPDFPNQLFRQLGDPRNAGVQLTLRF